MSIKYIKGDLLQAEQDIIVHQVNCQGKFGAGLAKQIADRYPKARREYQEYCATKVDVELMGDCLITETIDYDVANLFGQLYYGSYGKFYKKHNRQTDYQMLEKALETLERISKDRTIAIPYGMGCGLAKGDWNIVENIIDDVFKDQTIFVYKLDN